MTATARADAMNAAAVAMREADAAHQEQNTRASAFAFDEAMNAYKAAAASWAAAYASEIAGARLNENRAAQTHVEAAA